GELISDVDKSMLTGEFADYVAASTRAGLARGVWGWFDDDMACLADWGFELDRVERPVTVWQGKQDKMGPFENGQWLAGPLAGARAELHPEHGHLSLVIGSYDDVLDDLI